MSHLPVPGLLAAMTNAAALPPPCRPAVHTWFQPGPPGSATRFCKHRRHVPTLCAITGPSSPDQRTSALRPFGTSEPRRRLAHRAVFYHRHTATTS